MRPPDTGHSRINHTQFAAIGSATLDEQRNLAHNYALLHGRGLSRDILEFTEYDSLYRKLIAGRVDGAYMDVRVAKRYWMKMQKINEPPIEYDADLPHASDYFCLSSIAYPQVIKEFQQFLDTNKALIDELKAKYEFAAMAPK